MTPSGPLSMTALLWGSFTVVVVGSLGAMFLKNRRVERRIYWCSWAIGSIGIALAVGSRDGVRVAMGALAAVVVLGIVTAIRFTPYLKIGGRIIAASRFDRRPDPNDDDSARDDRPSVPLTAEDVRSASFSKPVGRQGYDPEQVDAFVERIALRLDGHGSLTSADIRAVAFSRPRPGRRGYDPDHVDEFLDRAIETLKAVERIR